MDYYYEPSPYKKFTRRYYKICFACAGISADKVEAMHIGNMCSHHQHERSRLLLLKYEKLEHERSLEKERNFRRMLKEAAREQKQTALELT